MGMFGLRMGKGLKREMFSHLEDLCRHFWSPVAAPPSSLLTESQFWMSWKWAQVQSLDDAWSFPLSQQMHLEMDVWHCCDKWDLIHYRLKGYDRGPQSPGHGPVPGCGLLGTGTHSRRWAPGGWVTLHLPLPIAGVTAWTPHPPSPSLWKNCLPQNRSLVPKRLGTTGLRGRLLLSW